MCTYSLPLYPCLENLTIHITIVRGNVFIQVSLGIAHFLGSTLFSFKYRSPLYLRMVQPCFHSSITGFAHLIICTVRTGWIILLDSEFLWTLFNGDNKWCQRRGCGGKAPARFSEHYSVRSGGAGAKPLLGSANTVQCQVRGCGGEAPSRISEHCSVSGLG